MSVCVTGSGGWLESEIEGVCIWRSFQAAGASTGVKKLGVK